MERGRPRVDEPVVTWEAYNYDEIEKEVPVAQ